MKEILGSGGVFKPEAVSSAYRVSNRGLPARLTPERPKAAARTKRVGLFYIIVFAIIPLIFTACAEPQPLTPRPRTGNPKLSSQLNQLVQADARGEAASFAQQQNIQLVDRTVRVVVESLPGQVDAAAKAVSARGKIEATDGNLLQALVPVGSLDALAGEPSIKFIRLPMTPAPGGGTTNKVE